LFAHVGGASSGFMALAPTSDAKRLAVTEQAFKLSNQLVGVSSRGVRGGWLFKEIDREVVSVEK